MNQGKKLCQELYDLDKDCGITGTESQLTYYLTELNVRIEENYVSFGFDGGLYNYFASWVNSEFHCSDVFRDNLRKYCEKNGLAFEDNDNVSIHIYQN